MAATQGIVSVIADQQAKAAVGSTWAMTLKSLSPRLTFVRGSIHADTQGHLDIHLLKRGLEAYQAVGLPVRAILELSIGPLGEHNPNDYLGFHGDAFKNAFIDAYTNRTISLLNDLGSLCPPIITLGNEFNVQAAPNPQGTGRIIPRLALGARAAASKPEALSPEAAWALTYHAAYWIKRKVPAVQVIYPASMSYDLAFKTSQHDLWIEGYINDGFAYLKQHSLKPPWPFTGLCLNAEGLLDAPYGAYIASGMAQHKKDHGIVGPTVIGEYGVPNPTPNNPVDFIHIAETARVLSGISESMAWFSAHPSGGYGCYNITYRAGEILPTIPLAWADMLPKMLASLP